MPILVLLILASLALALCALGGFIWAVKAGQFEDTCTPSMRILTEEEDQKQGSPTRAQASPSKSKYYEYSS
jgi:cbb3-type cytochrome oxidase maturation protein